MNLVFKCRNWVNFDGAKESTYFLKPDHRPVKLRCTHGRFYPCSGMRSGLIPYPMIPSGIFFVQPCVSRPDESLGGVFKRGTLCSDGDPSFASPSPSTNLAPFGKMRGRKATPVSSACPLGIFFSPWHLSLFPGVMWHMGFGGALLGLIFYPGAFVPF